MDSLKEWKYYEKGKKFNNRLDPPYYKTVETNLDFFAGNQWRNVRSNGMPTPVFNVIKRATTFFVSSITSQKVAINYEPLEYMEDCPNDQMLFGKHCADLANAEIENLFDKFKMDNRIRDALFDAATMGDVAAHLYFDMNSKPYRGTFEGVEGEIKFELIDGSNVYPGNPNSTIFSTDTQPYIIISGRDTVENLKREAQQYKSEDIEGIDEDKAGEDMAGQFGSIEIDGDENGKAQYIIFYKYDHDTDSIKVSKLTEKAYIYRDINTELSYYPVAWLPWEKQKNNYHGRALATGMIPNQIFINRMFAMVMYHLMMAAFPKAIYDADKIQTWNNEIGTAIGISGIVPGENIKNSAGYLEPGNMSNQIVQVIDLSIQHTKDSLGINDAMLGNINPEQASGKSIVATVQQSAAPLENQKANLYEWIEDIGRIVLDMMATYYGQRPIVIKTPAGSQTTPFDFAELKNMYLNCKCDVGASSYWSELASVETLDNLFEKGAIDIIEYLEALPDGYISNKQDLIDKIKERLMVTAPPPPPGEVPPEIQGGIA